MSFRWAVRQPNLQSPEWGMAIDVAAGQQRGDSADHEPQGNGRANGALDGEHVSPPESIIKRDGRVVPFDVERIENALHRCFASFERTPTTPVPELARRVVNIIAAKANGAAPSVESVQDIVEMVLQAAGEFEAAKRYILYRAAHAVQREERPIPDEVRRAFDESDQFLPTPLQ